ncbi:MAG: hypothetical protein ACK5LC_16540, partial [Coprobacillaceae bacterium]
MLQLIINIFEVVVFVMFVTRYHKAKFNKLTVLYIFIIVAIEEIFMVINSQSDWQLVAIGTALTIYQIHLMRERKNTYVFISILAMLVMGMSNAASILIITAVLNFPLTENFLLLVVMSRVLGLIVIAYFSKTVAMKEGGKRILHFTIATGLMLWMINIQIATFLNGQARSGDYILL